MLINIKTEYDNIILYSKKEIEKEKLLKTIEIIKNSFKEWEIKKEKYFKENNLDEKEMNYQRDNISYGFNKYGTNNKFMQKRLNNLQIIESKINEYYTLNKHPKYTIENELKKLGLQDINLIEMDMTLNLSLEKNQIKIN